MGNVNKIQFKNFRNFTSYELIINSKCNVFFGHNGSGKTNILEGISLLSKGKGFRNANISDLVNRKEKKFIIKSEFEKSNNIFNIKIENEYKDNKQKKLLSVNGEISKDTTKIILELVSFLYFLPEMERLFTSSPSYRRNFLDRLIFSEHKNYNTLINSYKKSLLERNKILQNKNFDPTWIQAVENEISNKGIKIYDLRQVQIQLLNEQISILNSNNNYPFNINFVIKDSFFEGMISIDKYLLELKKMREIDSKFGGCSIGPHKSDYIAKIDDNFEASQLSTGQQKTLVLMILMAQCNHLVNNKGITPILLFDEICSHLDDSNRKILLDFTKKFNIQFFFTGTEKGLFSFLSTNTNFYNITNT